jgi:hypothetical protein
MTTFEDETWLNTVKQRDLFHCNLWTVKDVFRSTQISISLSYSW